MKTGKNIEMLTEIKGGSQLSDRRLYSMKNLNVEMEQIAKGQCEPIYSPEITTMFSRLFSSEILDVFRSQVKSCVYFFKCFILRFKK